MQEYGNAQGNELRIEITSPDVSSLIGITKKTADTYADPYPAPCVAGTEKLP
jgi:hypothetical protein